MKKLTVALLLCLTFAGSASADTVKQVRNVTTINSAHVGAAKDVYDLLVGAGHASTVRGNVTTVSAKNLVVTQNLVGGSLPVFDVTLTAESDSSDVQLRATSSGVAVVVTGQLYEVLMDSLAKVGAGSARESLPSGTIERASGSITCTAYNRNRPTSHSCTILVPRAGARGI